MESLTGFQRESMKVIRTELQMAPLTVQQMDWSTAQMDRLLILNRPCQNDHDSNSTADYLCLK